MQSVFVSIPLEIWSFLLLLLLWNSELLINSFQKRSVCFCILKIFKKNNFFYILN